MFLIVGLGNPGKKYGHTRHNVGFLILDALAKELNVKFKFEKRFEAEMAKTDDVVLVKPQTFMNESGEAIKKLNQKLRIKNQDILVIHDEIALPFGKIRLSPEGTNSAGHKGVESIIAFTNTSPTRLRIGIENRKQPRVPATEDYVLQNFTSEEKAELEKIVIPLSLTETKKIIAEKQNSAERREAEFS